jgi:molybdopterin synthase catalytic subunit
MADDPTVLAHLTRDRLDRDALIAAVSHPGAGAVVTFEGVVRNNARGTAVRYLEYEAFVEMAEERLRAIIAEAGARWPGVRVAAAHRLGRLEIGETSVIVAASAPHRAEAFDACRFVIDTLKATVPIWKKEYTPDGASWVEG